MIATISPGNIHVEETLSTLRYAQQARKIVNRNHINEDPTARIIRYDCYITWCMLSFDSIKEQHLSFEEGRDFVTTILFHFYLPCLFFIFSSISSLSIFTSFLLPLVCLYHVIPAPSSLNQVSEGGGGAPPPPTAGEEPNASLWGWSDQWKW